MLLITRINLIFNSTLYSIVFITSKFLNIKSMFRSCFKNVKNDFKNDFDYFKITSKINTQVSLFHFFNPLLKYDDFMCGLTQLQSHWIDSGEWRW